MRQLQHRGTDTYEQSETVHVQKSVETYGGSIPCGGGGFLQDLIFFFAQQQCNSKE